MSSRRDAILNGNPVKPARELTTDLIHSYLRNAGYPPAEHMKTLVDCVHMNGKASKYPMLLAEYISGLSGWLVREYPALAEPFEKIGANAEALEVHKDYEHSFLWIFEYGDPVIKFMYRLIVIKAAIDQELIDLPEVSVHEGAPE